MFMHWLNRWLPAEQPPLTDRTLIRTLRQTIPATSKELIFHCHSVSCPRNHRTILFCDQPLQYKPLVHSLVIEFEPFVYIAH
jgi:hypothetical protein